MNIHDPEGVMEDWWEQHLETLASVSIGAGGPDRDAPTSRVVAGPVQAFLPLEGIVDVAAERERLTKAVTDATADLDRSSRKLANPAFLDKAPAEVVASEESKADEARARLEKLEAQLAELGQ